MGDRVVFALALALLVGCGPSQTVETFVVKRVAPRNWMSGCAALMTNGETRAAENLCATAPGDTVVLRWSRW